jgi:hypothetical protein
MYLLQENKVPFPRVKKLSKRAAEKAHSFLLSRIKNSIVETPCPDPQNAVRLSCGRDSSLIISWPIGRPHHSEVTAASDTDMRLETWKN